MAFDCEPECFLLFFFLNCQNLLIQQSNYVPAQVFLSNSINASKEVSGGQQEEIRDLKEKLEGQQTRLHRMQKELQFLVARQKVTIPTGKKILYFTIKARRRPENCNEY